MSFSCNLELPSRPFQVEGSAVFPDLAEGYDSLVMYACGLLGETDCRFNVAGFGSADWKLDVPYDLSVWVEQLPGLLGAIREGSDAEIDLYSQGIERTLSFQSSGDLTTIRCHSRTDWMPNPEVETIGRLHLEAMLSKVAENFARALEMINARIVQEDPFRAWLAARS